MGRIRSIKPELLEDEKVARLSSVQFRLFIGLIILSDDYGNFRASPMMLRGQIFWGELTVQTEDADSALLYLADVGLVRLYESGGQSYGHLNGWAKHQKVDKPGNPRVPGPDEEGSFAPFADEVTYFARAGETGPIKIGRSWNVADRVRSLSAESSEPLIVMATIPGGASEREMHSRFAHLRKRGEWFAAAADLLEFIQSIKADGKLPGDTRTFAKDTEVPAPDPIRSDPTRPDLGSGPLLPFPQSSPPDPDPDPDQTRSNSDAIKVTGFGLQKLFALVRSRIVEGALQWQTPPVKDGRAANMADVINADPTAAADVEPTMELFLRTANEGRRGPQSKLMTEKPAFGFAAWCSDWTPLREALRAAERKASKPKSSPLPVYVFTPRPKKPEPKKVEADGHVVG